ncbi:MAG: hypothetical protein LBI35_01270 [Burkholderiales bacterium]|nr:hypothetical protein [Burkholderiales bacterium]
MSETKQPLPTSGGSYTAKDGALMQTQAPTKPASIRPKKPAAVERPAGQIHRRGNPQTEGAKNE